MLPQIGNSVKKELQLHCSHHPWCRTTHIQREKQHKEGLREFVLPFVNASIYAALNLLSIFRMGGFSVLRGVITNGSLGLFFLRRFIMPPVIQLGSFLLREFMYI